MHISYITNRKSTLYTCSKTIMFIHYLSRILLCINYAGSTSRDYLSYYGFQSGIQGLLHDRVPWTVCWSKPVQTHCGLGASCPAGHLTATAGKGTPLDS